MIKGKMIQNSFVQGWLKELSEEKKKILQGLLYLLLKNQKLNWEKHTGENFFVPWVSFFLLALFAKDTRGGVAELEKSFLIQKCLSTQQAKTPPCVKNAVRHKNDIASLATVQGQALQINQASFYLKHTHSDSAVMLGGLSFSFSFFSFFFALQKFKSACFLQCIWVFFFLSFSFLMEKEERKMKSIFNVYRGARLNSLHSAETILNKLIFNEQPLCMRAK